ncbi:MAG: ABC transporter permease, partial [Syntrophales bacterium]
MDIFKRLLQLARPHASKFILAMSCMLVVGATTSSLAFLVKPALDEIFLNKNSDMLMWIPAAVIAIYLIKGVCNYTQTILMSFIGQRVVADLRNNLYRRMQMQSLSFFTKNPTGILMSRITTDVGYVQGAVSEAVTSLLKDSFTLICLVFVIFYRDWQLAIIAMFVFPLTIYPLAKFGAKMRNIATRTQVTIGSLTTLLQETISGTRIVKAFSMEEYENRRFAKENEHLFKLALKSVSVSAVSSPFMEFLGGIGIAAIIFYGGYQVIRGVSTPGTFFSFLTALIMLYEPVKRLTNVNNTIQQGIAGAVRVFSIIDIVPDIKNDADAIELPKISRCIDIRDVTFCYEET